MGIINLTPDSFSDEKGFKSRSTVKKQCQYFIDNHSNILDFGAESTAPFNSPVGENEELRRFETLLRLDQAFLQSLPSISVDTYKKDVFIRVAGLLRENGFNGELIWNDVSGIIEDDLGDLLIHFGAKYVFCLNEAPVRDKTSSHMDYVLKVSGAEFLAKVKTDIKVAAEGFERKGIMAKIIIDPCFGFSKTFEQNLLLLSQPEIFNGPFKQVLLGISRKSFLQKLVTEVFGASSSDSDRIHKTEYFHLLYIKKWKKTLGENLIVRSHSLDMRDVINKFEEASCL